ncbi:component of SufBCD complex [Frigidibacter sp. MR17.24]|uniref:component of SufBCD complex n=1 Tax=Frigidibacter sp. MR17.24 TaxID=3127345 RepID=UPI003012D268
MRSFSNLWYWIALAVTWSRVAHTVAGVPWDMVSRARRLHGQAETDLVAMLRISLNRLLYIHRTAGTLVVAVVAGLLTSTAILGFGYGLQLGQALFLIFLPLSVVGALTLRLAQLLDSDWYAEGGPAQASAQAQAQAQAQAHAAANAETGDTEALAPMYQRLMTHRLVVQIIAMLSILLTAMWGMLQNLSLRVL